MQAECFFKAPDERPEKVEHMGYPQLRHLYPPEELLVGPGIAPDGGGGDLCGGVCPSAAIGERRSWPARASICRHDRPTQSLRMSDWRRVVRDMRPTRLVG